MFPHGGDHNPRLHHFDLGANIVDISRAKLLIFFSTIRNSADNFRLLRGNTLIKNLCPAIAEPSVTHHQHIFITGKLTGNRFHGITAAALTGSITVPTMVIQNSNDPWTDQAFVKAYYVGLNVDKEMRMLDLKKNRFAAYDYLSRNPEGVYDWFDRYL